MRYLSPSPRGLGPLRVAVSQPGKNIMLVLSRTLLACRILHYLATCPGGAATRADFSKAVSAPFPYTGRIAYELLRAGYIKGLRGARGGYALAMPASEIRPGDVAEFIEDKRAWRIRLETEVAGLQHVMSEARQKFLAVLNEHSIADLCRYVEHAPLADRQCGRDADGGNDRPDMASLSCDGQGDQTIARALRLSRNTVRSIVRGEDMEHF